jgi:hypothetical protein
LDWLDYWKDAVLYPQSAFSIRETQGNLQKLNNNEQ